MADKSFVLRLEIENGVAVVRGLDDIGVAGEKAGQKLRQATENEASAGMRVLTATSTETTRAIDTFASRMGPLGNVLRAIGPAGLVAAAGIGGITIAAVALGRQAISTIRDLDALGDKADRLKINVETLQALQLAARDAGFDPGEADNAVQSLHDARLEALSGTKGAKKNLQIFSNFGISKEELAGLSDLDRLLDRVAAGAQKYGDQAGAAARLHKLGMDSVAEAILKVDGGIGTITNHYKESGQVLSTELIAKAGELNQKFDEMEKRLTVQLGPTFLKIGQVAAPILQGLAELVGYLIEQIGKLDQLKIFGNSYDYDGPADAEKEAKTLADATAKLFKARDAVKEDMGGMFGVAAAAQLEIAQKEFEAARDALKAKLSTLNDDGTPKGSIPKINIPGADFFSPGDLGDISDIEKTQTAAEKAAESLTKLAYARKHWRDDPATFGRMQDTMEGVSKDASKDVQSQTDALDKNFQKRFAITESYRGIFVDSFVQAMQSGDASGALQSLADTFTKRLYEGLANSLYDLAVGGGSGGGGGGLLGSVLGWLGLGGGVDKVPVGLTAGAPWIGSATGNNLRAGQPSWVGENGRELWLPSTSGTVIDAGMSARLMSGAGMGSVRAAPPIVNVITQNNGPPMDSRTETSQGADGSLNIRTILDPMVKTSVADHTQKGSFDKANRAQYGLRPQLTRS